MPLLYGRTPAKWSLVGEGRHTADATGADQTIRLQTNMAVGVEGERVRARHTLEQGEQLFCALSWGEGLVSPQSIDEANERLAATTRYWRAWLDLSRPVDHRWRYRTDETDDGLSGKEGSFLICSFWLVSALAIVGELQRCSAPATSWSACSASPRRSACTPRSSTPAPADIGNFHQAFSHLALIEAAGRIILAERLPEYTS